MRSPRVAEYRNPGLKDATPSGLSPNTGAEGSTLLAIAACGNHHQGKWVSWKGACAGSVASIKQALCCGLGAFATELDTERAADLVEFGVDLLFAVAHLLKESSVVPGSSS